MADEDSPTGSQTGGGSASQRAKDSAAAKPKAAPEPEGALPADLAELERLRARLLNKFHGRRK